MTTFTINIALKLNAESVEAAYEQALRLVRESPVVDDEVIVEVCDAETGAPLYWTPAT
jgi:hypothetical protein